MRMLYPSNYEEAVKQIEMLYTENIRLKRRIESLETQHKSTQRGRKSIINDEMIQEARQIRDEGYPIRVIAFQLGISVYTAHKILHMDDLLLESKIPPLA